MRIWFPLTSFLRKALLTYSSFDLHRREIVYSDHMHRLHNHRSSRGELWRYPSSHYAQMPSCIGMAAPCLESPGTRMLCIWYYYSVVYFSRRIYKFESCKRHRIINGDVSQVDLPKHQKSGLIESIKVLQNIDGIEIIHLDEKDVIRHRLVKQIINAFDKK